MKANKLQAGALLIAFILLSVFIFSFINPVTENQQTVSAPPEGPNNTPNRFLIGTIGSYNNDDMIYYDSAGFNITHIYTETADSTVSHGDPHRHTPCTHIVDDDFLNSDVHTDALRNVANNMYNQNQNHTRFFWQRPKIEWLCYGQSSIYEAENVWSLNDYWFYSFNSNSIFHNHTGSEWYDNSIHGSNQLVKRCITPQSGGNDLPGFVVDRLKANTEQCRRVIGNTTNHWMGDSECDWFVKPRMRIPEGVPDGTNVCKIYVIQQDGSNKIPPAVIKSEYFKNIQGEYNGEYIEEFNFDPRNPPSGLKFHGDLGWSWANTARGDRLVDDVNGADIQIEWLGNCDMWLDYVKVENDIANDLLSTDPNNHQHQTYESWIQQEVDAISAPAPGSSESPVYNFYIELFEFNNIPCMAYVNNKIQQRTSGRIGLMADLLDFYGYHMQHNYRGTLFTSAKLQNMFFNRTNFPQVFIGDPYPLYTSQSHNCGGSENDQYSQIPNTFTNLQQSEGDWMFKPTPPETYDAWLQGQLDTNCIWFGEGDEYPPPVLGPSSPLIGDFHFLMQHGNMMSSALDKPFIAMLQAHQWNNGELDREPTVEEENLMTNLAVSYGAKGIIYWGWGSSGNYNDCNNNGGYWRGIIENNNPRLLNMYGENKWTALKTTINRLKNWDTTIMKFNDADRRTWIYRVPAERNDMKANCDFIRDIYTYPPGCFVAGYDPESDPEDNRYVQVTTFDKNAWHA